LNKIIFALFVFSFIAINAFTLPEATDTEYYLDNFCVSLPSYEVLRYYSADNAVLISGGCYNVEFLSVRDFVKFAIPLSSGTELLFRHVYYNTFARQLYMKGYGLNWRLNDVFSMGFLANPTFAKRQSDFTLLAGFEGRNTKTTVGLMIENFDNNYSQKYEKDVYGDLRIYTEPAFPLGSFIVFPVNLFINTSGYFQEILFYASFARKYHSSADYYYFNESNVLTYDYTADTAMTYLKAGVERKRGNDKNLTGGIFIETYRDITGIDDSLLSSQSNDVYFKSNARMYYSKSSFRLGFEAQYENRVYKIDTTSRYRLHTYILYPSLNYRWNKFDIGLGEAFNVRSTVQPSDTVNEMHTRMILTVKYNFSPDSYFYVRKGFETDPRDVAHGGKFFFYDKMYVQFVGLFDDIFRRPNG